MSLLPEVGSSNNKTEGLATSSTATETRFLSPPEIPLPTPPEDTPIKLSFTPSNPNWDNVSSTNKSTSLSDVPLGLFNLAANRTVSLTVKLGNSKSSCQTTPTKFLGSAPFSPLTRIVEPCNKSLVGSESSPAATDSKDVLPA